MRVSRLYIANDLTEGETINLNSERSHYLRSVIRLKKGYKLTVFNGDGREFQACVETTTRDGVWLLIGRGTVHDRESSLITHLGLGISRGERMDFAIQKAVEMGVNHITPLLTEHCVVRLEDDKKDARHQHWQKVIRSACEQCGRNRLPILDAPLKLDDWLPQATGLRLLLDPDATANLGNLPRPETRVTLLSGPEGGFAEWERHTARQVGFTSVKLGPRILRTETAVLAALASVQTLWGDFNGLHQLDDISPEN